MKLKDFDQNDRKASKNVDLYENVSSFVDPSYSYRQAIYIPAAKLYVVVGATHYKCDNSRRALEVRKARQGIRSGNSRRA